MATNFASRYKKDLSTETLKTKLVRRKSILQKESRHKEFNKGRQFGLVDVNTQPSRDRELRLFEDTGEESALKSKSKASQIPKPVTKTRGQERLEMLERYKAEKELRKLKEQREKPVFKCGRVKPEAPPFLSKASQIPVPSKPKEKELLPPPRVTRSKTKSQLPEPVKPPVKAHLSAAAPSNASKGSRLRTAQQKQNQVYVDQPLPKDSKAVPCTMTTNGRATRSTTTKMTKIPLKAQPAGNLPQKRVPNKRKQLRGSKEAAALELSDIKENISIEFVKEELKPEIPPVVDSEPNKPILEQGHQPEPDVPVPVLQKRTRSFAPQNFVFKPLEGLTTYKVKPMSPSRADVFLSPHLFWSPKETSKNVPEEDAKMDVSKDCGLNRWPSSGTDMTEENLLEHQPSLELMEVNTECISSEKMEVVSLDREQNASGEDLPVAETSDATGDPKHDVPYFRNILRAETERLMSHCLEWDGAAETDIPDHAKDLIRTTIGQTRLLIAERFKQFEGLVDNCEFRRGEKETTCTDLEGFWDMVNFQVQDVNKKFENLKKLQENGWEMLEDTVAKKLPSKRKAAPRRATKTGSGSAETAAARKRLAAIKAAVKSKRKQQEMVTELVVPEMPAESEKIMFHGGFFQIESPAKSFLGQTPKSASGVSRRISRRTTPRSASRALLQSCADTCIVRQGTPAASNPLPPPPDVDVSLDLARTDILGCISEQSGIPTDEEPRATADSVVEEASEAQSALCDRGTPLRCADGLVALRPQGQGSPSVRSATPATEEEMQQAVTELGKPELLDSPKECFQSEGTSSMAEDLAVPACEIGPLLGDSFCDNVLNLQPNLNSSLLLTPIKRDAEKSTASPAHNDLIIFSPDSPPDGEK